MFLLKVGDPKQLPATVMSGLASKFLYECSMFERLQRAGYPVIMLTKQVVYHCNMFLTFYNTA
jgi:senataxin